LCLRSPCLNHHSRERRMYSYRRCPSDDRLTSVIVACHQGAPLDRRAALPPVLAGKVATEPSTHPAWVCTCDETQYSFCSRIHRQPTYIQLAGRSFMDRQWTRRDSLIENTDDKRHLYRWWAKTKQNNLSNNGWHTEHSRFGVTLNLTRWPWYYKLYHEAGLLVLVGDVYEDVAYLHTKLNFLGQLFQNSFTNDTIVSPPRTQVNSSLSSPVGRRLDAPSTQSWERSSKFLLRGAFRITLYSVG